MAELLEVRRRHSTISAIDDVGRTEQWRFCEIENHREL